MDTLYTGLSLIIIIFSPIHMQQIKPSTNWFKGIDDNFFLSEMIQALPILTPSKN